MIPTSDEIIGGLYRKLVETEAKLANAEFAQEAVRTRHRDECAALRNGHQTAMVDAGARMDALVEAHRKEHARISAILAQAQAVNARAVVAAESEYNCGRLAGEALAKLGHTWDAKAQRWRAARKR